MTERIRIIYYIYLKIFQSFHIFYRGTRRSYRGARRSSQLYIEHMSMRWVWMGFLDPAFGPVTKMQGLVVLTPLFVRFTPNILRKKLRKISMTKTRYIM